MVDAAVLQCGVEAAVEAVDFRPSTRCRHEIEPDALLGNTIERYTLARSIDLRVANPRNPRVDTRLSGNIHTRDAYGAGAWHNRRYAYASWRLRSNHLRVTQPTSFHR